MNHTRSRRWGIPRPTHSSDSNEDSARERRDSTSIVRRRHRREGVAVHMRRSRRKRRQFVLRYGVSEAVTHSRSPCGQGRTLSVQLDSALLRNEGQHYVWRLCDPRAVVPWPYQLEPVHLLCEPAKNQRKPVREGPRSTDLIYSLSYTENDVSSKLKLTKKG